MTALTTPNHGQTLKNRLGEGTFKKYESDLLQVVEQEKAGKTVPSAVRLSKYLFDEYGVVVPDSTIRMHLTAIRTFGNIRQ